MSESLIIAALDALLPQPPAATASSADLARLVRHPRLCLITSGSFASGMERLERATDEGIVPWIFISEDGSVVHVSGKPWLEADPHPDLAANEALFSEIFPKMGHPGGGGAEVGGFAITTRRESQRVEWSFGDPARDARFRAEFEARLPFLASASRLRREIRADRNRVDFFAPGFQPRVSIWPRLRGILGTPDRIIAAGAAEEDAAMAEALRSLFAPRPLTSLMSDQLLTADEHVLAGEALVTRLLSLANRR